MERTRQTAENGKRTEREAREPSKKKGKGKWALLFVLGFLLLIRLSLYDGLTVKKYTVLSDKITKEHTFLLISDLHCTFYGEKQEELMERIERLAPEAIFLAGDIADDVRPIDGCETLMRGLTPRYPCYYVAGNHERWSAAADNMKALFASFGAVVLDGAFVDASFSGDGFRICGIFDPLYYPSSASFRESLADLAALACVSPLDGEGDWSVSTAADASAPFVILLSHRPEYAEYYGSLGFDLTLCGHAHGGQVRIPFLLNGLYAPNQGWFPPYAGGRYDFAGGSVIVSRGLMRDDLPRVWNPPEMVLIRVAPQ